MRSRTHLFITALVLALLAASASCCPSPTLGGCKIFPDDDEWNRPIDTDPVDYNSDCLVAQQMSDHSIHLDLGVTELNYGIPYTITSNSDPLAVISVCSINFFSLFFFIQFIHFLFLFLFFLFFFSLIVWIT